MNNFLQKLKFKLYYLPWFIISVVGIIIRYPTTITKRLANFSYQKKCYWLHCSSVGEVKAMTIFIQTLKKSTNIPIFLTAFTINGFKESLNINGITSSYLPFDSNFLIKKTIKRINPLAIIIMETELWANMIYQLNKKNIPIFIINARLSDKSFIKYKKYAYFLINTILQNINIYAIDYKNSQKLQQLGAKKSNISILGNLKMNIKKTPIIIEKSKIIQNSKKWHNYFVFVAGSVRNEEQEIILDIFQKLKKQITNLIVIIAPRHEHQYLIIEKLCYKKNITLSKYSISKFNVDSEVYLIDTIGQLTAIYSVANIIFVGGSLQKKYGGHNFLEAYLWQAPVIIGKYNANFNSEISLFKKNNAIMIVENTKDFMKKFMYLSSNKNYSEKIVQNAKQLLNKQLNISEKIIKDLLEKT